MRGKIKYLLMAPLLGVFLLLLVKTDSQAASNACLKSVALKDSGITYEFYNSDLKKNYFKLVVKPTSSKTKSAEISNYKESVYGGDNIAPWLTDNEYALNKIYEIEIGEGIVSIGDYAFADTSYTKKITFPSTLKTIGNSAFLDSDLEELVLPDSVTSIGKYAFKKCERLRKAVLPANLKVVPACCFSGDSILIEVVMPKECERIESSAFYDCTWLRKITFPSKLRWIGANAFYKCKQLHEISLPSSVKHLEESAFKAETAGKIILNNVTLDSDFNLNPGENVKMVDSKGSPISVLKANVTYNETLESTKKLIFNYSNEDNPSSVEIDIPSVSIWAKAGEKLPQPQSEFDYLEGYHFEWYKQNSWRKQYWNFDWTLDDYESDEFTGYVVPNTYKLYYVTNRPDESKEEYGGSYTCFKKYKTFSWMAKKPDVDWFNSGYVLVGWNTKADGSGTSYGLDEEFTDLTLENEGTVKLYAVWEVADVNVIFNGGEGSTGEMAPWTCKAKDTSKLPANQYKKTGYHFWCWDGECNGRTFSVRDQNSLPYLTGMEYFPVYLTPCWAANSYYLKFDGNGGYIASEDTTQTCIYDSDKDILKTFELRRANYKFVGWNTKPDGTGETYQSGEKIKNLTAEDEKEIVMYAMWEKDDNVYEVSFDGNGATRGSMDKKTMIYDKKSTLPMNNYLKTGYSFVGWSLSKESECEENNFENEAIVKNLADKGVKSVTLYAQWKPICYMIVFEGNEAETGFMDTIDVYYDEECELPANEFVKDGYTFVGWNTKADGSGNAFSPNATVKNLTIENNIAIRLYAQWEEKVSQPEPEKTYTISYVLNGGKNAASNPGKYTKNTATIKLSNASRKGYKFLGWYADKKFKTKVTTIKTGSSGNKTFYSKWAPVTYKIKFAANGGKGSMKAISNATYDKQVKLTKNTYKRTGYKFLGWSTNKKAKKATYKNQAGVKNLATKNGATVTLYAIWQKK